MEAQAPPRIPEAPPDCPTTVEGLPNGFGGYCDGVSCFRADATGKEPKLGAVAVLDAHCSTLKYVSFVLKIR